MPGHPSHFNKDERILLFQDGSQLAFEQCYQENIIALCYFTEKIVNDRTVAEDIAAECFIKNVAQPGAVCFFTYSDERAVAYLST